MDFTKKNILLVIHHGALGGAERQCLGLSKILTEKYSCQVDLLLTFSGEMDSEFEMFAQECNIRNIHHYGSSYLYLPTEVSLKNLKRLKWSLEHLFVLWKNLKPYKFDIIIPYLNFPSKLAFYLYKILPTVKFTFWHQLGLDKWSMDYFERYAAKHIPCVIANSPTGLRLFEEHYVLKKEKKFVLPQYLSLEYRHFDSSIMKKQLGLPCDHLLIGMVAQYRYDKYHELLLESFKRLTSRERGVHLVFLGNKNSTNTTLEKYNFLKYEIFAAGLEKKVSLLTNQKVEHILNVLDIGVLVSKIEGMPNAVMEYMAYGLPVIASNHPGCRQLIQNGENGLLIKNDEEELLQVLLQLIKNPGLRFRMGKKNQDRIKQFSKESYVEELRCIMNKVIPNA